MIKLIIAEDHESLIDGLQLLFKYDEEIKVIATAKDGKELLEILHHKTADIVLSDVSMPRMNGVELCTKINEKYPETKVIAFSMFENEDAIRDMIKAGAHGYVLKRRTLNEVRKAIIAVANGERYFDPSIRIDAVGNSEVSKRKTILSPSESEILKLIAQGKSSSEIAAERFTAVSTVSKHRKNMIQKLGLQGKGELMRYALGLYKHYK
ncbi:LuxR family two component transcriptional regulator [Nonlabens dokdonensis]|uniref:DNA-binding response regulator, LuxR family n=2 Tax=Nonlabens dokdonensis TaxID=328515 RepID=L7WCX7_NONDD|nr:response regulator transcription factor [Nonlabens dokdonensis]AGC77776.1 DNA-binding response regulator, LuxR family [Nonlabens dokdonensis DSW-6]PZX39690.1 LuxR family two component transcriptional regulator [Nonlabens dokdonensis]